jgi:hypothetical protein
LKNFWDEKYSIDDYYYGIQPNQFLKSSVRLLPKMAKVLCIGEGEGRNAVFLSSLGFSVTAVDFSEIARKKALELAELQKVQMDYQVSDLSHFHFDIDTWDAVISIFCHLPPELRAEVHDKIQMSLKKDGLFITQAYTPEQLSFKTGGPKDIQMLYTETILRADFKKLDWVQLVTSVEEIQEGIGHHGMSSVISGVGKKMVLI